MSRVAMPSQIPFAKEWARVLLPAPLCKEELRIRDFSQCSEQDCHMNVIALLCSIPDSAAFGDDNSLTKSRPCSDISGLSYR